MAKKYVPSGYLICNFGNVDLSSTLTLDITNENVKNIFNILDEKGIPKKPILINLKDTNSGEHYNGFAYYETGVFYISVLSLAINRTDKEIEISIISE